MIPSVVASDIRSALVEFLSSTFALADDEVRDELSKFLTDPADGIFRGPYLRVRTPFRAVDPAWRSPLDWTPDWFVPYQHQATAFDRLSSAPGRTPQPTLVTTGTGSGKTECFLFPILDHCARERALGRTGIKALILYPMNALASDQAGRLAQLIASEAGLAGVTAGLYVGEEGHHSAMGADHLIDLRNALRADPPDILLTNYKMLDFLLLRREDHDLWATNEPDTLRYVVLDEFHTYDGAQGTDVAMLLRRLGATLGMAGPDRPLGEAVPVATSATLGSGPSAVVELCDFASKVFGTDVGADAVVGETRQTVDEACGAIDYLLPIPEVDELAEAGDDIDAIAAAFCRRETSGDDSDHDELDVTDVEELGKRLLTHSLTRAVLAAVGDHARSWDDALAEINTRTPSWGRAAMTRPDQVARALGRYIWLLSLARRRQGDQLRPLFSVEVQLWVREVSRLLRRVSSEPGFRWVDSAAPDADDDADPLPDGSELPAVYCRRCGMSGWMAVRSELGDALQTRTATVYTAALNRSAQLRVLLATSPDDPEARWYDPASRHLTIEREGTSALAVPVLVTPGEEHARAQTCPACDERDTIRFLGLQVASLASVAVNTLFASPHLDEPERKLLAFTDSVQDASHRAAFFAGRTHRINLRTLMAGVIAGAGDITLADLGDVVVGDAAGPRERFGLVPPDLLRHPKVRTVWSDDLDPAGLEILASRIGFEADVEFGLRARVGRTLELSRAAVATVDVPHLDEAVTLVAEDLRRIDPDGAEADLHSIELYLLGLLERLRLRGGIHHRLLEPYVREGGRLWFVWGGRPDGLPPFTPGQGRPLFFTTGTSGDFDSLTAASTTPTWAADWARRTLGAEATVARQVAPNAFKLLASVTDAVASVQAGSSTVWGLDRRFIRVWDVPDDPDQPDGAAAAGVRCRMCGARHPTPPHDVDRWVGTPCLRYRCAGIHEPDVPRGANYYRGLYRSGITRRVVTAEHTGLLGRRDREDLERAFKDGTAPDAPNVISATPTLEMGIDIGDLSAVMLTSVPRTPASYIQRVGRAGRATGNALVTTFVRTDTHGLYYLSDPEAMIAGEVRPPNCYLDAIETLQRQFVAYLLDRTADRRLTADPLPGRIEALMKLGLDEASPLRRLVDAATLETEHVDAFLELFGDRIADETRDRLREFAGGGIEAAVKSAIDTWTTQDRELGLRRRRLTEAIDRLLDGSDKARDGDEQIASLRGQRAAIIRLLREHRDEYTLSALERLGLLPNYTLTGDVVTLRATLWWTDADGEYHVERTDYARAAQLAVRELAPGNSFYAGGHRHHVDALETGTAEEPLYETWRMCPDCGYGTIETEGAPPPLCPRCGGRGIADTGARHSMLRLRTALASASEEAARVYDESDERQRERYEVITTIDADPDHVRGAWVLAERTFGAELSSITHLRTVNLGFSERSGTTILIAGEDRHVTRFTTCRHCGAVRDVRDDRNGARPDRLHQGWCKVRTGAASQQWDPLALYHQLTTEAVRMLLPLSMFEIDERLASFKGALLLGLREDFGGDPDHLDVLASDMPNRDGQGKRRFLVIYDRVPGGTGYLARLADPERVRAILSTARRLISRCPCQSEGRPACHRCLLGVVDRFEYELVRRDLALELLDDLLDRWTPEPVTTVAAVDIGKVEESELERRFKVALRDWAEHPDNEHVTFTTVPGKGGYDAFELHITRDGQTMRYRVDEQEGLSTTPSTQPDFMIRREDDRAPDIAVYLDGYQFHASPEVNNLAADSTKRAAVRATGALVWNLTWDGVDAFHRSVQHEQLRQPPHRPLLTSAALQSARTVQLHRGGAIEIDVVSSNPVALLLEVLGRPDPAEWERVVLSTVAGAAAAAGLAPIRDEDVESVLAAALAGREATVPPVSDGAVRARVAQWSTPNDHQITAILDGDGEHANAERWTAVSSVRDAHADVTEPDNLERWRDHLQWSNLVQFLRGPGRDAVICAASQASELSVDHLWLVDRSSPVPAAAAAAPAEPLEPIVTELSEEQRDLLDEILIDSIRALVENVLLAGAPDAVAGDELAGEPVEASWPRQRVGVLRDGQHLELDGWDLRPVSDWTPAELLDALRKER